MRKIWLPESKKDREEVYYRFLQEAESVRNISAVEWYIVKHYLQGCRYFETIEYHTGIVRPSYKNEEGGVPFKMEEIVQKVNTEVGRLLRLDTSPSVPRQLPGLDGLRKESTAQSVLSTIYPYTNPEENRLQFYKMLVELGCAGLYTYELPKSERDETNDASNVVQEVVPPWELLFLPANTTSAEEAQCIVRDRWVPLEEIKGMKILGKSLDLPEGDEGEKKMQVIEVPWGSSVSDQPYNKGSASRSTSGVSTVGAGRRGKKGKHGQKFARVYEIITKWNNGRIRKYEVMVGKHLAYDKSYKNQDKTPMCNLSVATCGPGLYGRSFAAILVHINAEIEAALYNLFKNGQDFDMYGMLGIPVSFGVDEQELQAVAPGGRRYFWLDMDPSKPNDDIKHIQPVTSGQLPAQIANVGFGVLDRLSQQPDIITQGEAPGRVDSKVGMDYLYQASTVPLGRMAASIADAYSGMYKAWLGFARNWDNIRINMDTLSDDSIIGITLDPEAGTLELGDNAVPDPTSLQVGIKSQKPINKQEQKQILDMWYQAQIISPQQYRIHYRTMKLEPELPRDAEWENYRMAILRNIVLFNDGRTPGELPSDSLGPSEYDNPEIQLMVIRRLMSSPEFSLASTEVQNKFKELVDAFENAAGQYPEALEMPEDLAEQQQMEMQQAQQMGMSGALPDELVSAVGGQGADISSLLGE